jgi:hypothetical protein
MFLRSFIAASPLRNRRGLGDAAEASFLLLVAGQIRPVVKSTIATR